MRKIRKTIKVVEREANPERNDRSAGPGRGTLVGMLVVLAAGAAVLAALVPAWHSGGLATWQLGALTGFGLSGLMGLSSLWTLRRAMRASGQGAFVRAVFGSMLLRLVLAGLLVGLVLGFGWLNAAGFVGGLFAGLLVFQGIEIGGVAAAARRAG
jgi:hypothetical protein